MAITVSCDECFQEYRLNDSLAGKKVKCKECGGVIKVPRNDVDDDDESFDDGADDDDEDDDEPPRRKATTSRRPPPLPKGRSRASETPPPIPTKKSTKSKKSSGYHDALDDVPTWLVLTIMWVTIIVMCLLFWLLGGKARNPAAQPGVNNQNANAMLGNPLAAGGGAAPVAAAPFPIANAPLPQMPELPNLVPSFNPQSLMASVRIPNGAGIGMDVECRVWMPQGQHSLHSLGCVFMTPEHESNLLLYGNQIGDLSDPQILSMALPLLQPCLSSGYAVVAFSVGSGPNDADFDSAVYAAANQRFKSSQAGMLNFRTAVEWVSTKVNQVDPKRLYVGGYSEAGSIALLAAAHEPRIKGCVVINPVCDVPRHYAQEIDFGDLPFEAAAQDSAFLQQVSPNSHLAQLQCPIYLVTILMSVDLVDPGSTQSVVHESTTFAEQLRAAGRQVFPAKFGPGDYQSLLAMGSQQAVGWLKTLPSETPTP